MTYPPAGLPFNRTNATPQTDTHPNDHNLVNQAVNDLTGHLTGYVDPTLGNVASRMPQWYSAIGGNGNSGGGGEAGTCRLQAGAVPVAGRLLLWGTLYLTKSVSTDIYRAELRTSGGAVLIMAGGDSGNGPQCQLTPICGVDLAAGNAIDVSLFVVRSSGTGIATFVNSINRIDALFIGNP